MRTDDAAIGFDSGAPRIRMPYSVSMPQTLWMATAAPYPCAPRNRLQVLPGRHPLDGAPTAGLLRRGHERAHVHDALALLARDLGPVVGVGGVREVLVLLVLLVDRGDEVVDPDAR